MSSIAETAAPMCAKRPLAALLARLRRAPASCVALQWQGDAALALARVRIAGAAPLIESLHRIDVPGSARTATLARLQRDGALRGADVHLLLSPGDYELHQLAAPAVPEDELRAALRWQLRSALAYPAEQAQVDYLRIPDPPHAPPRHQIMAISAQRARVESATAALVEAGIAIASVDVPELAQRNLTSFWMPAADGSLAWLSFDRDTCLFTVNHGDELVFARRMLMPSTNEGETGPEAAERLAERIATQVQRSLDLFERGSGLPQVTRIAVGPHNASAPIARQLADRTGLRSDVVEQFDGFADGAPVRLAPELAAPLGLALRAALPAARP